MWFSSSIIEFWSIKTERVQVLSKNQVLAILENEVFIILAVAAAEQHRARRVSRLLEPSSWRVRASTLSKHTA